MSENVLSFLRQPEQVNPETQAIAAMVSAERSLYTDAMVAAKAHRASQIVEVGLGRPLTQTEQWLIQVGSALSTEGLIQ